ncbi:hypothetical protein [Gordonia sp. (in: high G+C Gram-positive bacteria)]|uniref:hypothetical protein n=1 Tax=Gordonia sp. (in: high G+C Gram-positive bacteria) TaxID=84139 RepID=UPI0039E3F781
MTRNRKSAKSAGSRFEREIAETLARALEDDRIERRARSGAKDRGDIAGLRLHGKRIVVEAKNCARIDLAGWMREAEVERGNDDALVGVVAHKRHGKGDPLDQWVTMTVREFIAILRGDRIEED